MHTFKYEKKFDELAQYNAEVVRGLVHTAEKVEKMEKLQQEYNEKLNDHALARGHIIC